MVHTPRLWTMEAFEALTGHTHTPRGLGGLRSLPDAAVRSINERSNLSAAGGGLQMCRSHVLGMSQNRTLAPGRIGGPLTGLGNH